MTTAESLDVQVADKGGLKREITFQVPADAIEQALNAAYDQVAKGTRMPGFRNGKVPRQVIKARFGEQVHGDVLDRVVPEYYRQAVEQAGVEPVTGPEFGPLKIEDGKPLAVSATLEVRPEVKLAPYEGMDLDMVDTNVTEEDVAVAHRSLQESVATLEPAEEGHVAESGDVAVIDFSGSVDGEKFDGGTAEGYTLTLGDGQFIPGFEEQLIGHQAGESFDITVTFPEDYHSEDLKGKEVLFAINLTELKRKVLPELDDAFASQVGDFADMEELNNTLSEQIQTKRAADQRALHRQVVFAKLADDNVFDAPESWVEEELDHLLETQQRLATMQGQDPEMDQDAAREAHLETARIQARGRIVVAEIAKAEGIDVGQDEFAAEIGRLAQEYQRQPEEIANYIRSNPAELSRMNSHLLKNKVLDAVIDKAEMKKVDRDAAPEA